jgi:hypothetical protein
MTDGLERVMISRTSIVLLEQTHTPIRERLRTNGVGFLVQRPERNFPMDLRHLMDGMPTGMAGSLTTVVANIMVNFILDLKEDGMT